MTDLQITVRDAIARVTIARPPVNALTIQSYRQITDAFVDLGARDDVRCIILTGGGERAFCAGFDFRRFEREGAVEDDPKRPDILHRMFMAVRECALPVIAAVNGPAIGSGCVLAAVCDIRVASEAAKFGLPEIDFGRVGGGAYLARLVPPGILRRMAFTGRTIDAQEALRTGMVDEVVAPDSLDEAASSLAASIAEKPGLALRHMKAALNRIETMSVDEGYRIEQDFSSRLRAALEVRSK